MSLGGRYLCSRQQQFNYSITKLPNLSRRAADYQFPGG